MGLMRRVLSAVPLAAALLWNGVEAWTCNSLPAAVGGAAAPFKIAKALLLLAITSSAVVEAQLEAGSPTLAPGANAATSQPTSGPTFAPSAEVLTAKPTPSPLQTTRKPTKSPTSITSSPTRSPDFTSMPTAQPTSKPTTRKPTRAPTRVPVPTPPTSSPTKYQGPYGPNILFMLADDLGYGEVGIMPGRRVFHTTTPNIDNFFTSGMRFTDFYANQECAPSRCALMTGKHLGHSTIRSNSFQASLLTTDVTFLELLRDLGGYQNSCIGKWHLAGTKGNKANAFANNPIGAPWNQGCDRFFGAENWAEYYSYDKIYRYSRPSGLHEIQIPDNVDASRTRCMAANNTCVWLTDLNLQEALAELEYHKARQDAEIKQLLNPVPFFLYMAWTDPHTGTWGDFVKGTTSVGNPVPSNADFASQPWDDKSKDHAADVHIYHDTYVQIVFDKLDELGLRNDTVVVYMSDNGGPDSTGVNAGSNGPFQGWKTWLTEGGIRVPAAIRWPGKIAAGAISSEPLAIWDFFPTFLSIAGVPKALWPTDIDGTSFYEGVLLQTPASGSQAVVPADSFSHPPLYWESCNANAQMPAWAFLKTRPSAFTRAVRQGKWKGYQAVLRGNFSELRLYDMTVDPAETTDLRFIYPDVVRALQAVIDAPGVRTASVGPYNYTAADNGCLNWYGSVIRG